MYAKANYSRGTTLLITSRCAASSSRHCDEGVVTTLGVRLLRGNHPPILLAAA